MAELSKDFKPTLKSKVDPSELLAQKQAKKKEETKAKAAPV